MGHNREAEIQRWHELIAAQQVSGRSIAAYCREHSLRLWQFYEWKKRLQQKQSHPSAFVAVSMKVEDVEVPQPSAECLSSAIELRHRSGWGMMVEPGFDADHLRRLLSILGSPS
jgi:hypothetical protein